MEWFVWAMRTPSRLVVLMVIGASLLNGAMAGERETLEGFEAVVNMAGGICILGVLVLWRPFWCGPAVRKVRGQHEALSDPGRDQFAQQGYAAARRERLRKAKEVARQRPEE